MKHEQWNSDLSLHKDKITLLKTEIDKAREALRQIEDKMAIAIIEET